MRETVLVETTPCGSAELGPADGSASGEANGRCEDEAAVEAIWSSGARAVRCLRGGVPSDGDLMRIPRLLALSAFGWGVGLKYLAIVVSAVLHSYADSFEPSDVGNWAVVAGVGARRGVVNLGRRGRVDTLTSVSVVFAARHNTTCFAGRGTWLVMGAAVVGGVGFEG